jgi:hypothetical protein
VPVADIAPIDLLAPTKGPRICTCIPETILLEPRSCLGLDAQYGTDVCEVYVYVPEVLAPLKGRPSCPLLL